MKMQSYKQVKYQLLSYNITTEQTRQAALHNHPETWSLGNAGGEVGGPALLTALAAPRLRAPLSPRQDPLTVSLPNRTQNGCQLTAVSSFQGWTGHGQKQELIRVPK